MIASFVLDASIALAWCFADEGTEATRELLLRMSVDTAAVPSLWFLEVANVLAIAEQRRRIKPDESAGFLRLIDRFDLEVDDRAERRAFSHILEHARAHRLTAYDATYLDMALHYDLPLATRDDPLRTAAERLGVPLLGM